MIKERKYYSFYNSFCEIVPAPSSKFSASLSLKMDIYAGNFHIPMWMKSPIFVSTLTFARDWAIRNHILQQNQPLQMYLYHPVSGRGKEQCRSGLDTILSLPREHLKQNIPVCTIPAPLSRRHFTLSVSAIVKVLIPNNGLEESVQFLLQILESSSPSLTEAFDSLMCWSHMVLAQSSCALHLNSAFGHFFPVRSCISSRAIRIEMGYLIEPRDFGCQQPIGKWT